MPNHKSSSSKDETSSSRHRQSSSRFETRTGSSSKHDRTPATRPSNSGRSCRTPEASSSQRIAASKPNQGLSATLPARNLKVSQGHEEVRELNPSGHIVQDPSSRRTEPTLLTRNSFEVVDNDDAATLQTMRKSLILMHLLRDLSNDLATGDGVGFPVDTTFGGRLKRPLVDSERRLYLMGLRSVLDTIVTDTEIQTPNHVTEQARDEVRQTYEFLFSRLDEDDVEFVQGPQRATRSAVRNRTAMDAIDEDESDPKS